MSAIKTHDEMVAAFNQQAQANGRRDGEDIWTGALAARFRDNPRRELDPTLSAIAEFVRPDDVLIDAGGGAGRMSLPLALRCREVINVDPSPGMREVFESVRAETGIENAGFVQSDWLEREPIEADVVLAAHVTYFVPDIEGFVRRLVESARRRVIINIYSVPPPNSGGDLFALQHKQPQARVPGHAELLPALWQMGILPDVRVLPDLVWATALPTREQAIESLVSGPPVPGLDADRLRQLGTDHFDTLFIARDGGWVRAPTADARSMLITWETASA